MLDVSLKKMVSGAKHWFVPLDQLYRPTSFFGQDSQEIVYARDVLTSSKFVPILLKELFYLVKSGGYLIIDYQPQPNLNWPQIEEFLWWLWRGKYQIIYHQAIEESELNSLTQSKLRYFINHVTNDHSPQSFTTTAHIKPGPIRLICQKTISTKVEGDTINKWSFGIITNGQREDWVKEIIKSIRNQKIPHYEIIMCGIYEDKKEKDIRYLPFNSRDEMGWITKKKNLIANQSKYENLCIIHNRMVLSDDWYHGIKKWGNCFEILSTIQLQKNTGNRGNHWASTDLALYKRESLYSLKAKLYFTSDLDYKDWSKNIYQYGQAIIIKRSIMLTSPQNETLYWGMPEDHVFSLDLLDKGYFLRFNPYSTMYNLDNKKWFNNVKVRYSSESAQVKLEGPFIKLLYRKLIETLLNPFKDYKLLR